MDYQLYDKITGVLRNTLTIKLILYFILSFAYSTILKNEKLQWWKGMIPIYRHYVMYKLYYKTQKFWQLAGYLFTAVFLSFLSTLFYVYVLETMSTFWIILFILTTIGILVLLILYLVIKVQFTYRVIQRHYKNTNDILKYLLTILITLIPEFMILPAIKSNKLNKT